MVPVQSIFRDIEFDCIYIVPTFELVECSGELFTKVPDANVKIKNIQHSRTAFLIFLAIQDGIKQLFKIVSGEMDKNTKDRWLSNHFPVYAGSLSIRTRFLCTKCSGKVPEKIASYT